MAPTIKKIVKTTTKENSREKSWRKLKENSALSNLKFKNESKCYVQGVAGHAFK